MKNILVAINFEENELLVVEKALEMAKAFEAKVWLMHIAAPNPDFVGNEVGPQSTRDFRAVQLKKQHRLLDEYAQQLRNKGVEAEGMLIQGATIETLLEEAEQLNIDLLILGNQVRGFFYKTFVGSVSQGIIKRAKLPILLVPLD
jgi:nucleotide-binding universal stress UspA family protein